MQTLSVVMLSIFLIVVIASPVKASGRHRGVRRRQEPVVTKPLTRDDRSDEGAPTEPRKLWAHLVRDEASAQRVVEAIVELAFAGETLPTRAQVAERAGMSTREISCQLADEESLRNAVRTVELERHAAELATIDPAAPFEERLAAFVAQRVALYEALTVMRTADLLPRARAFERDSAAARRMLRDHAAETFAPEIAAIGPDAEAILDGVDFATSWESWNHLRSVVGRRQSRAARALEMSVTRLVKGPVTGACEELSVPGEAGIKGVGP
jgi:hypothetical protein